MVLIPYIFRSFMRSESVASSVGMSDNGLVLMSIGAHLAWQIGRPCLRLVVWNTVNTRDERRFEQASDRRSKDSRVRWNILLAQELIYRLPHISEILYIIETDIVLAIGSIRFYVLFRACHRSPTMR